MALTITCGEYSPISIEDYVEFLDKNVDVRDFDSIIASAPQLGALAADGDLVPRLLTRTILDLINDRPLKTYTPQSFVIAKARDFFVRGNVWTKPLQRGALRTREEEVFSYRLAHDHNFHFITVGYFGPGYETEIYEVDPCKIDGYIGERVDLEMLERTSLPKGKIMAYRAHRDLHIQYPPTSLTISLNLMCLDGDSHTRDQYFFDVKNGAITGFPENNMLSRRASVVEIAALAGNHETLSLIEEIAVHGCCRRTRIASLEALCQRGREEAQDALRLLVDDSDCAVRRVARVMLERSP